MLGTVQALLINILSSNFRIIEIDLYGITCFLWNFTGMFMSLYHLCFLHTFPSALTMVQQETIEVKKNEVFYPQT
jgi:hypothetical protein